MGFLKFVFFLVVFFYLFRLLMRFLMPFLLRKMAQRFMKNANESPYSTFQGTFQFDGRQHTDRRQQRQKNGKVSVDYVPPKEETGKGTATAGEFIDFEEVK